MKKILVLLTAVCFGGFALAQSGTQQPFSIRSLTGKSIEKIYARTSGGNIAVTGINSGEARLEVYVSAFDVPARYAPANLSKEEIQKVVDEGYDFSISTDNNFLSVSAKRKETNNERRTQLSITFRIFVPHSVSSDLGTSGGSITLDNLSGTQELHTSGGNIRVDKLSGKTNGRTSGGSISVSDSKDNIDLTTSGGNIVAENCSGNIILSTSGGSIRGNNIDGKLLTHTSGGSIRLENISGSVDASTSGGSMNVSLKELGEYIKLNTSGGNVNLDMPGNKGLTLNLSASKIRTGILSNFTGSTTDSRRVNGTLNGGGIPVSVKASGNINLALR